MNELSPVWESIDPNGWMNIDEGNVLAKLARDYANTDDLHKQWKAAKHKFVTHRWIQRFVTPKQEEMLNKYFDILKKEDVDYSAYRRAFVFICKFMGLPNKGVMLERIKFSNDKKDKEARICAVQYSKGAIRVKIPEGCSLIHVSPVEGISALNPSFRNKKLGIFMYPSKRVFFTVSKDIKAKNASLGGQKLYRYRAKQDIKYAYIDPSCSDWSIRAVYVETDTPVPVERYDKWIDKFMAKLTGKNKKELKNKSDMQDAVKEMYEDIEWNLDNLDEGFSELIERMKTWKTSNKGGVFRNMHKFESETVSDEDFAVMTDCIKHMRTEPEYKDYKKYFDKFCSMIHTQPDGTIIFKHELKSKGGKGTMNYVKVTYFYNTHKVEIPSDARLYHMSTVKGIKALRPSFRGKTGYFCDKPRVYFTLNKDRIFLDRDLSKKLYYYTTKQKITQAYVDPMAPGVINSAIYVESDKPIPVIALNSHKEIPKNHKKESVKESAEFMLQTFSTIIENGLIIDESYEDIGGELNMNEEITFTGKTPFIDSIMEGKDFSEVKDSPCYKIAQEYKYNEHFRDFVNETSSVFPKIPVADNAAFIEHVESLARCADAYSKYNRMIYTESELLSHVTPEFDIQLGITQAQLCAVEQAKLMIESSVIDEYAGVFEALNA